MKLRVTIVAEDYNLNFDDLSDDGRDRIAEYWSGIFKTLTQANEVNGGKFILESVSWEN